MKKLTYCELRDATEKVTQLTYTKPMRAQYVLGAFEVMLAQMAVDLPRHKQLELIESLDRLASRAKDIA